MVDISKLAQQLTEKGQQYEHGFPFTLEEIKDDVTVLKISVEDREELPVFVSVTGDQLLCIAYLFSTSEVQADQIDQMNSAMLRTNLAIPLSSFALLDKQYVIFGALALTSSLDEIVHEIEVLSSNALDAIEAMREYLA